jgi:hypothetical protein
MAGTQRSELPAVDPPEAPVAAGAEAEAEAARVVPDGAALTADEASASEPEPESLPDPELESEPDSVPDSSSSEPLLVAESDSMGRVVLSSPEVAVASAPPADSTAAVVGETTWLTLDLQLRPCLPLHSL